MKDVLIRTASSVVAAIIVYVALTMFAEQWGLKLRLTVAVVVAVCAFLVAIWASRTSRKDAGSSTRMATNIRGESALIENVHATVGANHPTSVASDIKAKGPVEIKGASVHQSDTSK